MPRTTDSPAAPRVSPPDLPEEFETAQPRRGADIIAAKLELTGNVDLAHSTLEQCVVTADVDTLNLTGATLLDVDVHDMRAASVTLRNASVRRVRVSGGRIGTLDLSGSRIGELELRDVRIDYLNLGASTAVDVLISHCTIRTLDMPQAELTRIRFDDCRSDEVDPRGLRAKDVDLRGLDAAAFTDANSLRGTTVTTFQMQQLAPVIAAGLGIQLRD